MMPGPERRRCTRVERALRWGGVGGIVILLSAVGLRNPEALLPLTCTFRDLTGVSCLTCGLTRSFHALMHGDPAGAAGFHLMGPVLFIAVILAGVRWAVEAARGEVLRFRVAPAALRLGAWALGVLWFGYWVVRLAGELR